MTILDTVKIHGFVITTPWTEGVKIIDSALFAERTRDGLNKKKVKKMYKNYGYYYVDRWTFNAFLLNINRRVEGLTDKPCVMNAIGGTELDFNNYPRVEIKSDFLVVEINGSGCSYLTSKGYAPLKNKNNFTFVVPLCK
jgi:hypothetical protein